MRFLEREVYTFCGKRVRGVMPWARIFFCLWEGRNGPAADGPRVVCARACGQNNTGGGGCGGYAGKGKKGGFFFSGERLEGCLLCPLGGGRDRAAAIAAWEVSAPSRKWRGRTAAQGRKKTQLVEG